MRNVTGLLSRDDFREGVWVRDGYRCVVPDCGKPAVDAHHLYERRLWTDGGYYLSNGVSVCEQHHIDAETTKLSVEELQNYAGIIKPILPPQLSADEIYDKWGNPILPNGMRLRGELFWDESVQKVLAPILHIFTKYVKYSRTYHLPWSPGCSDDDRILQSLDGFVGKRVIVTAKMDGENTTLYNDYIHARSLDYSPHPSRDRIKQLHGQIAHDIPDGWRVCGENLFAKHSIHYSNLSHYFLVFSIWNEKNICLSWEDTVEWTKLLGLHMVPVLYDGEWDEETIQAIYTPELNGDKCEGYVVRLADQFSYKDFRHVVGKYVRANHVEQNQNHWITKSVIPNNWKE